VDTPVPPCPDAASPRDSVDEPLIRVVGRTPRAVRRHHTPSAVERTLAMLAPPQRLDRDPRFLDGAPRLRADRRAVSSRPRLAGRSGCSSAVAASLVPTSFTLRLCSRGWTLGPPLKEDFSPPPPPLEVHPYDRSSRAFLADLCAGRVPAQGLLEGLPAPLHWVCGALAIEVLDFRLSPRPTRTRTLLRLTSQSLRADMAAEENIVLTLFAQEAARKGRRLSREGLLAARASPRFGKFVEAVESAALVHAYPTLRLGASNANAASCEPMQVWATEGEQAALRAGVMQRLPPPPTAVCVPSPAAMPEVLAEEARAAKRSRTEGAVAATPPVAAVRPMFVVKLGGRAVEESPGVPP